MAWHGPPAQTDGLVADLHFACPGVEVDREEEDTEDQADHDGWRLIINYISPLTEQYPVMIFQHVGRHGTGRDRIIDAFSEHTELDASCLREAVPVLS
jgi:hypothetical protein